MMIEDWLKLMIDYTLIQNISSCHFYISRLFSICSIWWLMWRCPVKILVLVLSLWQKFRLLSSGHPKTLPFQMHESFLVQRSCPSFCRGRSIAYFLGLGGYGPSSISTTS